MSRCLPFPPQGYAWNGVCGEDLLQRIKEGAAPKTLGNLCLSAHMTLVATAKVLEGMIKASMTMAAITIIMEGCTSWVDLPMFPASIHLNGSMQKIELQFGEYWIPGPLHFPDCKFDNQDWLRRTKQLNDMMETSNAWRYDLCHGNSTLYPHAMYFLHAVTYAYPFGIQY
ncbi:hypothetical protein SLEP1_g33669 [Rubroshorea leprosula]|uniref:Uncharacterized protein n=1 Tax=Rubroshorea leprosula TaxID=152421 RepID=A0AAV5KHC7_9ROSI|nr:hypothetical protein SLEP1_g33669 [Rubroshorea leprosula]